MDLRVIERDAAQGDERHPLGEHQRHQQVVAAGHLAHQHQRRERCVRDATVERAHADERERTGLDRRIVEQEPGSEPERAPDQATDRE